MKLEKREITLNEADSLQDMMQMERNVLIQYATFLCFPMRKQAQNVAVQNASKTVEDLAALQMLAQGVAEEQV